jgi:carboxylesterase
MIIPTAEPFFFPGNQTGCLLVHGFTGAPKEMRWMGEYLSSQGYTVLGVRLAGHATKIEDMMRMKWWDWLASVEDGYWILNGCTSSIFIIGLSMGGILSLLFSSHHKVNGVVVMSTLYTIPEDPRLPFISILSGLIPTVDKGKPDWHNPDASKDHVDYPFYPTKGVIQLRDLLIEMHSALPKILVPALIVHSKADGSVPEQDAVDIYRKIGSSDKELMWVENSGHVIPREPDRQLVFNKINEFIQRVQKPV